MPTWDLTQGGSASAGSCANGCQKYSTRNIAGQCCSCRGNLGTLQRTATAGVYRCSAAPVNGLGDPGVPSPFVAHAHPYPTRYHGAIYTRPEFGLPYVPAPFEVFMPRDFAGLGCAGGCNGGCGKGSVGDWNTADGVFRQPREAGGGIFNDVSGLGAASVDMRSLGAFAAAALFGMVATVMLKK
jgi:hypothetical protein